MFTELNGQHASELNDALGRIGVPLLATAGDDDPVCVPAELQAIAEGVARGAYAVGPGRHICNLESPQAFTAALAAHLSAQH